MKALAHSLVYHLLIMPGGVYLRFSHRTILGSNYFYTLEWLVTLLCLVLFALRPNSWRSASTRAFRRFARRKALAVGAIFCLSLFGRIALLTIEPFPAPVVHDEFSYLLGADTFAHGHFTSPPPLDPIHFEAFHVLLSPTFNSMYPPAAAVFYGVGQALFGTPRAGLLLLMALACAALCWMLQAFLPPEWALLGGVIGVVHISWFSYFGNTFWGGAAAMLGGCLLLGAGQRLRHGRQSRWLALLLLAVALILLLNNRPYEGGILALPLLGYLLFQPAARARLFSEQVLPAAAVILLGLAATGIYVHAVTHSASLPWSLQREQWAITPPFIFQKPTLTHTYHFEDEKELYVDYEMRDYNAQQHPAGFLAVLGNKLFRQWDFFLSPTLSLAFLFGLGATWRSRRSRPLLLSLAILSIAFLPETWVQPQYVAVATGILYVILLNGLRSAAILGRRGRRAGAILPGTLVALLLLVGCRLVLVPLQGWPPAWCTNGGEMLTYQRLQHLLQARGGKQLVLVHYPKDHAWQESWINNLSNPQNQQVLWARNLGSPAANAQLLCDYPNRTVWTVIPPPRMEDPIPDTTDPARYTDLSPLLVPYPYPTTPPCPTPSP